MEERTNVLPFSSVLDDGLCQVIRNFVEEARVAIPDQFDPFGSVGIEVYEDTNGEQKEADDLKPLKDKDLIALIRDHYSKYKTNDSPCEVCEVYRLKPGCVHHCPDIIPYIKTMSVKFQENGKPEGTPCFSCTLKWMNKNVCTPVCPKLKKVDLSPLTLGNRGTLSVGRRKCGPACP